MKVIFLDIDGVLNSFDNLYALNALWKLNKSSSRDEYGQLFDERCVRWLQFILERTDAKIVISSTWRSSGIAKLQTMWQMRNLPGEIIDCTPTMVDEYVINLHACTNNEADRGYEIQQWIEENKPVKYCIIDDDNDMLGIQLPYFVRTDNRIGLDYKTAHKAIAILNAVDNTNAVSTSSVSYSPIKQNPAKTNEALYQNCCTIILNYLTIS